MRFSVLEADERRILEVFYIPYLSYIFPIYLAIYLSINMSFYLSICHIRITCIHARVHCIDDAFQRFGG